MEQILCRGPQKKVILLIPELELLPSRIVKQCIYVVFVPLFEVLLYSSLGKLNTKCNTSPPVSKPITYKKE
jgi:hypothetical protein